MPQVIYKSQAMFRPLIPIMGPTASFEAGRIESRNGDTPFPALLSSSTTHPYRLSLQNPTLSSPVFPSRDISVIFSCAPLPSHLPSQECWVFKEIRRYSSLKINNHTLEIPDSGARVLDSEGVWRPGWRPSCLVNVASGKFYLQDSSHVKWT